MSFNRIDLLKKSLDDVNALLESASPEDKKKVEVIFRAFGKPEHLNPKNQFIASRILHFKNSLLRIALGTIHQQLSQEYRDVGTQFKSGNMYYDELTSFIAKLLPEENKSNKIVADVVTKIKQKLADIDAEFGGANTIETMNLQQLFAYYDACKHCESFVPLDLENLLQDYKSKNIDITEYSKDLYQLQVNLFAIKLQIMRSVPDRFIISDPKESDLVKTGLRDSRRLYQLLKECLEQAERPNFLGQLCDAQTKHSIKSNLETIDRLARLFQSSGSYPKSGYNARPVLSHQANDIDYRFEGKVLAHELWMTQDCQLDKSSIPVELKKDCEFLMDKCCFELAASILPLALPNNENNAKLNLYLAQLHIIRRVGSYFFADANYLREFNLIYFTMRLMRNLKSHIALPAIFTDDERDALGRNLERAFGKLYTEGCSDRASRKADYIFVGEALAPQKFDYYADVLRAQQLNLAAEILVLLRHLKFDEMILDDTEVIIKNHVPESDYRNYFEKHGSDGLLDILMNQIHQLEKDILTKRQQLEPKFKVILAPTPTAAECEAAERAYHEVVANYEVEQIKIKAAHDKEVQHRKEADRKKLKNRKAKSSFFKNPHVELVANAEVTAPPLSATAALYYKAGYERQSAHDLEPAINTYLAAVSGYVHGQDDQSITQDYFYVAAALIELAHCYLHRAVSYSLSIADMNLAMLENYQEALHYAKKAEECFIQYVPKFSDDPNRLKDFDYLSQHIYAILNSAKDKLTRIKAEHQLLKENLNNSLHQLKLSRIAAIERAGGFARWKDNVAPKNTFSSRRNLQQEELSKLKEADIVIEKVMQVLNPVNENFGYLAGKQALPLLTASPEQGDMDNAAVSGKGSIVERVTLLYVSNHLLKSGHSKQQSIKLIRENITNPRVLVQQEQLNKIEYTTPRMARIQ